jgi:hypothetical protein
MPRTLVEDRTLYSKGSKEPIAAGDLEKTTIPAGRETTVWAKQVGQDQLLWHGNGPEQREFATAFIGLDLVATGNGNGDGTDGDAIQGDVILAITDSDQRRVLASVTLDTLAQLRDALDESRTDRIVEAALGPYAKPGRHLEVRIDGNASSDGYELDPVDSTGNLYYTRLS